MKTRPTHIDTEFAFGPRDRPARCRIRIFRPSPDRPVVVVVTELPGAGLSVTNAVEAIARGFSIDPDCLLFVEDLAASCSGPEQFSVVSFECGPGGGLVNPSWSRVGRVLVERFIGAGASLSEGVSPE